MEEAGRSADNTNTEAYYLDRQKSLTIFDTGITYIATLPVITWVSDQDRH